MTEPTPIEVTDAMIKAGYDEFLGMTLHQAFDDVAASVYRAMAALDPDRASLAQIERVMNTAERTSHLLTATRAENERLRVDCEQLVKERDHALSQVPDPYWKPTDADVESLAIALFAGYVNTSFGDAKSILDEWSETDSVRWWRVARAAFDHPGYLPSIVAARQDHVARIRELERDVANLRCIRDELKDRITDLETERCAAPARNPLPECLSHLGQLLTAKDMEIRRLRASLAYYAAPDHWDGGEVPGHIYVIDDDGRGARETLGLPTRIKDGERFDVEMRCREIMREFPS